MFAVYKRTFTSLMTSIFGFLFAAVLLLAVGVMMYKVNLRAALADMSYNPMLWGELTLALTIPLLCTKSISCDKKLGVDRLYASLPLTTKDIIMGRFLALLTVFTLPMAVLLLYPLILNLFGTVNFSGAYTSLLLFYLLGAALIALCLFISSLTKHIIISAGVGIAAGLLLYFLPQLAILMPMSSLFSFIGFSLLALLLIFGTWLFTHNTLVAAIVAVVTVLPLTVLYILDVFVCHWDAFVGLLPLLLTMISPFFQFQNVVTSSTLDLMAVIILLSYTFYFLFLSALSTDRRHTA